MRQRMRAEFSGRDACKHGEGGLVDIDFVVQLGVLEMAHDQPGILAGHGSVGLLDALAECGWLAAADARLLADTHRALAHCRHLRALSRRSDLPSPDTTASWALCRQYLE
jgi:glutamate-ammonia-ligase adenylyltransferase